MTRCMKTNAQHTVRVSALSKLLALALRECQCFSTLGLALSPREC